MDNEGAFISRTFIYVWQPVYAFFRPRSHKQAQNCTHGSKYLYRCRQMQPAEREGRLTVKAGINSLGVEVMNNRDYQRSWQWRREAVTAAQSDRVQVWKRRDEKDKTKVHPAWWRKTVFSVYDWTLRISKFEFVLYTCSRSDLSVFLSRVGLHIGRFRLLVRSSSICEVTSKVTFSLRFFHTKHTARRLDRSDFNSKILLLHLFKTVLWLHWIPQPISILFVVTKPGSKCCQLPSKAPEEDREEEKEATASLCSC